MKSIIPFNIIDIWTRLEVLLGVKLSGNTDTLTDASSRMDELFKEREIQNERKNRKILDKVQTNKNELASKLSEQKPFITRPKRKENLLIVMDKTTHEENLLQSLQKNNEQLKKADTF